MVPLEDPLSVPLLTSCPEAIYRFMPQIVNLSISFTVVVRHPGSIQGSLSEEFVYQSVDNGRRVSFLTDR